MKNLFLVTFVVTQSIIFVACWLDFEQIKHSDSEEMSDIFSGRKSNQYDFRKLDENNLQTDNSDDLARDIVRRNRDNSKRCKMCNDGRICLERAFRNGTRTEFICSKCFKKSISDQPRTLIEKCSYEMGMRYEEYSKTVGCECSGSVRVNCNKYKQFRKYRVK